MRIWETLGLPYKGEVKQSNRVPQVIRGRSPAWSKGRLGSNTGGGGEHFSFLPKS